MEEFDEDYGSYERLSDTPRDLSPVTEPLIPLNGLVFPHEVKKGLWIVHYNVHRPALTPYEFRATVLSDPNEEGAFSALLTNGTKKRLSLESMGIIDRQFEGYNPSERLGVFTCHAAYIDTMNERVLDIYR